MSARRLLGLGIIATLLFVVLGDYLHRVLNTAFFANSDLGDAPLIMYSLLLGFVVRPFISGSCAAIFLLLGGRTLIRETGMPPALQFAIAVRVGFATALVSVVWASIEAFLLHGFWP